MNVYMARYDKNPGRPHRLMVEFEPLAYQDICQQWNVTPAELRVELIVGEKSIYLVKARSQEGFKVSPPRTNRSRWRVEFRSDTYKNIRRLPTFGVSFCQGVMESNGAQIPKLVVNLPQLPAPARPYRPRKTSRTRLSDGQLPSPQGQGVDRG